MKKFVFRPASDIALHCKGDDAIDSTDRREEVEKPGYATVAAQLGMTSDLSYHASKKLIGAPEGGIIDNSPTLHANNGGVKCGGVKCSEGYHAMIKVGIGPIARRMGEVQTAYGR
jgi:hypothetical protein